MIIQVTNDYPSTTIGDELAIVNAETGSYILLNQVGGAIWEKITAGDYTREQLIDEMLEEYEVSEEECTRGVDMFLEKLAKCKLIDLEPVAEGV